MVLSAANPSKSAYSLPRQDSASHACVLGRINEGSQLWRQPEVASFMFANMELLFQLTAPDRRGKKTTAVAEVLKVAKEVEHFLSDIGNVEPRRGLVEELVDELLEFGSAQICLQKEAGGRWGIAKVSREQQMRVAIPPQVSPAPAAA